MVSFWDAKIIVEAFYEIQKAQKRRPLKTPLYFSALMKMVFPTGSDD